MFATCSVDVNVKCHKNKASLAWAMDYAGTAGVVRLLLNHPSIDLNSKDNFGYTPLMNAILYGPLTHGVAGLLQAHPSTDPNIKDDIG
jgi:hypothetical protein